MITRDEWLRRQRRKSENDHNSSINSLKKWDLFLEMKQEKNEGELLQRLKEINPQPDFYIFLNDFVSFMIEQKLAPRSIKTYFYFIKEWLRSNGLRIYNEDVKHFVRFPKIPRTRKEPLTKDMIKLLLKNSSARMKAMILILVSSGMRIDELLQLRPRDFKEIQIINLPDWITKTDSFRITFISAQAARAIEPFLVAKDRDSCIFVSQYKPSRSVRQVVKEFARVRNRSQLIQKQERTRYHIVTLHRLRAFCKTTTSLKINKDFSEWLIGHYDKMNTYFSKETDELFKIYQKVESELTI